MTLDGTHIPLPPAALKKPVSDTHHGIKRTDDYAWLRADNWQEVMRDPSVLAPDIRSYLQSENDYADKVLATTDPLRETLFEELKGRIKQDDSTVPSVDGAWAYSVQFSEGKQYPILVRAPRNGGDSETLLDVNVLAEDKAYYRLGGAQHSTDHKLYAYSADDAGSEYYTLKFKNLETGDVLPDHLTETASFEWADDNKTLYYVWLDENHRPAKVFRHTLGCEQSEDELIYEETDPGFFVGLSKTQSGSYILIECHDHETSEIHTLDARDPKASPICFAPRNVLEEYTVEHRDDLFYILTNSGGAEDFKIVTTPLNATGRENWQVLKDHTPGCLLLSMTVFSGHMIRLERVQGLPKIVITELPSGQEHEISFDEEAYSLGLSGGYEFDTTEIRFTYSSMTTPSRVFDYDMVTRARTLRKETEIPSGHDPELYVTRRIMAPAPDGESVPISLFYHKDTQLDGSAPCLLYGYGSYGIAMPASFSANALSIVDRGFVYAIAHVRGGKEKGYRWYRDGRKDQKNNTFSDFLAAGHYLIKENFTRKGVIVAQGGSAGGMLVGAAVNMEPDLFCGVIAEVPFVDVLTTMLDDTLPLTPPEWPEWGNPIENAAAYETIASYSPYDNVEAKGYPPILAVAGLTDPRVTYWEPAKWVAKLRATKTDDHLLLLKTNMDAGHGGASGRFERLHEIARNWTFALMVTDRPLR